MLNAITISHVWVLDQDEALDFYVGKLGLEVTSDQNLGFMRWLTVGVPGQPGRDILLEIPGPPSMDEATADQIRGEITRGASGFAVGFSTDDMQTTYAELKGHGVDGACESISSPYRTTAFSTTASSTSTSPPVSRIASFDS